MHRLLNIYLHITNECKSNEISNCWSSWPTSGEKLDYNTPITIKARVFYLVRSSSSTVHWLLACNFLEVLRWPQAGRDWCNMIEATKFTPNRVLSVAAAQWTTGPGPAGNGIARRGCWAWIAVFDGRARLDRPGLVQYRTHTEYSASHRPSTRASRTKDGAPLLICAAPAAFRRFDASASRRQLTLRSIHYNKSLNSRTRAQLHVTRVFREWRNNRAPITTVDDGMAGGAGRATCAQLSRRLPPFASLAYPRRPFIVLGSGSWTSRLCCYL